VELLKLGTRRSVHSFFDNTRFFFYKKPSEGPSS